MDETEAELWRSSYPLPEEAQARVHRLIMDTLREIDNLNLAVVTAKGLKRRRKMAADRLSIARAAVSSLKLLPAEILSQIFIMTQPPSPRGVILPLLKDPYPWILGHVCARWRDILWCSPFIWNNIFVLPLSQYGRGFRADIWSRLILKHMNHILAKTGVMSLSLNVQSCQETVRIWDTILRHNERFRTLSLRHVPVEWLSTFLDLPPHSLGNLERLDVTIDPSRLLPAHRNASSLQTAPNLRMMSVHSSEALLPLQLLLPWTQLTDLEIVSLGFSTRIVHDTLQSCISLLSCKFKISPEPIPVVAAPLDLHCTIYLHKLKKFHLIIPMSEFDWADFLRPIIFPSLSDLDFLACHLPLDTFTTFLTRSMCSLETLALEVNDWYSIPAETDLVAFLRPLSTLNSINIRFFTPSSIITELQFGGLLQLLDDIHLTVTSKALGALLDVLDQWYIPQIIAHRLRLKIRAFVGGPASEMVYTRYAKSYQTYQTIEGLDISAESLRTGFLIHIEAKMWD
jgi:hypothetical protein